MHKTVFNAKKDCLRDEKRAYCGAIVEIADMMAFLL